MIGLVIAAFDGIFLGIGQTPLMLAAGIFVFMSTFAVTDGSNQAI